MNTLATEKDFVVSEEAAEMRQNLKNEDPEFYGYVQTWLSDPNEDVKEYTPPMHVTPE